MENTLIPRLLFVFTFLGPIWFLTEATEGFLFRHTSNHSADSNEGCLKTDDVFTCFLVKISDSASS